MNYRSMSSSPTHRKLQTVPYMRHLQWRRDKGEAVVIVSAEFEVSVKLLLTDCCNCASEAVTWNVTEPALGGVPDSCPPEETVSHEGNELPLHE